MKKLFSMVLIAALFFCMAAQEPQMKFNPSELKAPHRQKALLHPWTPPHPRRKKLHLLWKETTM